MAVCTRKSDGQVFVQWKEAGKTRRKYFGVGVQARAIAEEYNKTVSSPALGRGGAVQGPQFVELVNAYMRFKQASMSQVSFENTVWKFDSKILPILGEMKAASINHSVLDKYVTTRAKYVKMTTVHRELSDVRAVLGWAVKRRLIASNPMAGYEMPKRDDAVVLPLSVGEIEKIIEHSSPHLRRAMLLSFFLGLRPGAVELLSIKYAQVNWSAMTLTVISANKGGVQQREIPIHASLPLWEWYNTDGKDDDAYIITWQGKPVKTLKTSFRRAKERAEVGGRKIPMYALRHAFVTSLLHRKIDIHTIANISGHDVRTMLKHYAHAMDDVRSAAIDALPALNLTAPTSAVGTKRGKVKK